MRPVKKKKKKQMTKELEAWIWNNIYFEEEQADIELTRDKQATKRRREHTHAHTLFALGEVRTTRWEEEEENWV